jgi:hypothetical protein
MDGQQFDQFQGGAFDLEAMKVCRSVRSLAYVDSALIARLAPPAPARAEWKRTRLEEAAVVPER